MFTISLGTTRTNYLVMKQLATTPKEQSVPFALVNVTNIKCTIIQVTDGKECSQTLYPFRHDLSTEYIGPKIKLVFSRLRRHYDVAVDMDFVLKNLQVPESNAKGILLILLNKYTQN